MRSAVLASSSQWINAVCFKGHEDESLSARSHRQGWKLEGYLDWFFLTVFGEKDHCRINHVWEQQRAISRLEELGYHCHFPDSPSENN